MKKQWWICILPLLFLVSTGCGRQTDATTTPSEDGRFALLEDYPEDILPLYACDRVTYCLFEMKEEPDYTFGQDLFMLSYQTEETAESVLAYYRQRIAQQNMDLCTYDRLSGMVGAYPAVVSVCQMGVDLVQVTITLGLPDEQEPDENWYFENCPGTVFALGGNKNSLHTTAFERFDIGTRFERYVLRYRSHLSLEEFSQLYEDAYGDWADFSMVENDNLKTYAFEDVDHRWTVSFTKTQDHGAHFLSIICWHE